MKAQRCLHRKVRALVAQRERLIRELRAARATCRQLLRPHGQRKLANRGEVA